MGHVLHFSVTRGPLGWESLGPAEMDWTSFGVSIGREPVERLEVDRGTDAPTVPDSFARCARGDPRHFNHDHVFGYLRGRTGSDERGFAIAAKRGRDRPGR